MKIAFDLDEVLVQTYELWKHIVEKDGYEVLDHKHFQIKTEPPMDQNTIMKYFSKVFLRYHDIPISEGAEELLTKVYETTLDPIYIISNRPREHAYETIKLIDRLKVPYKLTLTVNSDDKWKYLHGYKYYVDDRRRTARLVAAMIDNIVVFVPSKCYNNLEIKTLPKNEKDRVMTRLINKSGNENLIKIDNLEHILNYLSFLS